MGLTRRREGHVEILTLDRPEARNAIDPEITRAMDAALDELEADPAVRALVVTGAGSEAFCSGVDLKVQAAEGIGGVVSEKGGFAGLIERQFPKPLIAAVNGYALGGGLEIVLACDIAIAADHATFASTEVRWGQLADGGGLIRLPNRIPLAIAAELVLTGRRIDAARAAAIGLINHVVAPDQLLEKAIGLGQAIAENSPIAVELSKQLLLEALSMPEKEAWRVNASYSERIYAEKDWLEGPAAFVSKRDPQWSR